MNYDIKLIKGGVTEGILELEGAIATAFMFGFLLRPAV